jgi:hypothetical protein
MTNAREPELIEKGTPCYVDYFDRTLLTVQQVRERGYKKCVNIDACNSGEIPCIFRMGLQVAQYVAKGSELKRELMQFSRVPFRDSTFWYSEDGIEFQRIRGRTNVLEAVEKFARIVLLQDTSQSVLTKCEKCQGVKLEEAVTDSIWFREGPGPCSGGGGTRTRIVEYCPNCEQIPRGGIVYQEDLDKERAFLSRPI